MNTQYLESRCSDTLIRDRLDCCKQESSSLASLDLFASIAFPSAHLHSSSYTSYGSTVIPISSFRLLSSRTLLRPSQASLNRLHELAEKKCSSKYWSSSQITCTFSLLSK